jgi:hypothetical protein
MKPNPQAPASTGAASFGAAAFLLRVSFTVIARLDRAIHMWTAPYLQEAAEYGIEAIAIICPAC